jgi:hypothetical protein
LLALAGTTRGQEATPASALLGVGDVVAALTAIGLEVEMSGQTVEQPFFAVPAHLLSVEGFEAQIYTYPDAEARAADAATISDDGTRIDGANIDWIAPPHFSQAGNLLVLVLTDDADLATDVETAVEGLVAGATPVATPAGSPVATPVADGLLEVADVAAVLRSGGLRVEETGQSVESGLFGVPSALLRVDGVDLQVLVYPSVAERVADSDRISDDGTMIGTVAVRWIAPPHFAFAGNIITLILTDDDALADRVEELVGTLGGQASARQSRRSG